MTVCPRSGWLSSKEMTQPKQNMHIQCPEKPGFCRHSANIQAAKTAKQGFTNSDACNEPPPIESHRCEPFISAPKLKVKIKNPKLWSIEKPNLYDFTIKLKSKGQKQTFDTVKSYGGLRSIEIRKNRVYLNNKPLYQRLVLDQGFYPKGIWTAPSDKDLKNDILLSIKSGFNGARLHEKVFEDRFHYWADKLGYITWAEFPNWGLNENAKASETSFMHEWPRIVDYLKNHPSIITWTPFNETNTMECNSQHKQLMRKAYAVTKKIDPTRPVNETSGYQHQKTDIWTVHHYEPNPEKLKKALNPKKGVYRNFPQFETSYSPTGPRIHSPSSRQSRRR